ncbi:type II toxin-antitoxin system Phd/YefM family antitoxin [Mesorhizobium sp. M0437]|uniref:type II toxin-antitoxin system Phd/YefM family antitoxin n=1 Tax=Mesorhizobium sp. M0437 TaxID=2956945 RepID=UPI00333D0C4A
MQSAPKEDANWTVARAKARLSEVIERAQAAPQTITRNGRPSVVVVSAEEWQRKTVRKGTLAEFLLECPQPGAPLAVGRPHPGHPAVPQ